MTKKQEQSIQIQQIVILCAAGRKQYEIAESLGITEPHVSKLMRTKEFDSAMAAFGDASVQTAANIVRTRMEKLAHKANAAIEWLLDSDKGRDKAEGVKIFTRVTKLDQQEGQQANGDIIIQLPGQKTETVIETTGEEVEDAE